MNLMAKEVSAIKTCANTNCETVFEPTRHNQKYCSKNCCKIVTNAKIMENYYEKRARKSGKKRICKSCETAVLSRYNEGSVCQSCKLDKKSANRLELLQLIGVA
jgi:hypothetical protein